MKLPPPHVTWPSFVVLLLLVGIGSAFSVFFFARKDGRTQVVEEYYKKASHWDETQALQAASNALHWNADVSVGAAAENALRPVVVRITGPDGRAVTGLSGAVAIRRPQMANPLVSLPLAPRDSAYVTQAPIDATGLWYFDLSLSRDTVRYIATVRREL